LNYTKVGSITPCGHVHKYIHIKIKTSKTHHTKTSKQKKTRVKCEIKILNVSVTAVEAALATYNRNSPRYQELRHESHDYDLKPFLLTKLNRS